MLPYSRSFSQGTIDRIRYFNLKPDITSSQTIHSSIQPLIRYIPPQPQRANTLVSDGDTSVFYTKFSPKGNRRSFAILPATDSYFQYDTALSYRAAVGFNFEKTWGKWYNRTLLTSGWSLREDYTQTHVAFSPLQDRKSFWFTDIRTRLGFTPNDMLHISTGIDNQFFGEGYRSLIQGNQVAPNPFVQFRVNFRNLEYGLLYQFLHDNNYTTKTREWKYNTTHYLSANIGSNFNIMLLETVVFQGRDSTYKRGYEVEYLNPFVFFRPQEYSLGSTDNIILALQSSYYFASKKHCVYFQLPLDEFVLKEIKNRSKWWANKYGAQLGIKGQFKKWSYLLEGNLVRPYTFSHISSGQNNGSLGLPLGHYLGSNFAELLATAQIPFKNFQLTLFSSFYLKGYDDSTVNYGGDIYKSYTSHPKEYRNTIGQGMTQRAVSFQVNASTTLDKILLEMYIQAGMQYSWGELGKSTAPLICIGFRNNLFNERKIH
jgi:hypothetical protein